MHDFDAEHRADHERIEKEFGEHSFTLRGEPFKVSLNLAFAALKRMAGVTPDTEDQDTFVALENEIRSYLPDQESRDRFSKVVAESEHTDFPVTFVDMLAMRVWMQQAVSGRPPTQPDSSSGSPSTNGTSETESSSPEPAEASTS